MQKYAGRLTNSGNINQAASAGTLYYSIQSLLKIRIRLHVQGETYKSLLKKRIRLLVQDDSNRGFCSRYGFDCLFRMSDTCLCS